MPGSTCKDFLLFLCNSEVLPKLLAIGKTCQLEFAVTPQQELRELVKYSGAVTGKHLFGDVVAFFADGFQKLAIKDIDGDGIVNLSELGELAVYDDSNSNAKVDAEELNGRLRYGIVGLNRTHWCSQISGRVLSPQARGSHPSSRKIIS